jgi:hypothetical protein
MGQPDMMAIGKVTGYKIGPNKDGSRNVILLQVQITDPDDVQTVQMLDHPGEEFNPPNDSEVLVNQIEEGWKVAIAIDDLIAPTIEPGEKKIYASDGNGNIIASIYLDKNGKVIVESNGNIDVVSNSGSGTIKLNSDADNAVAYSKLKTAFDQLKSDFNTFVTTVYNLHKNGGVANTVPDILGSSSSADMSNSKIASIQVPSS